MLRGWRDPVEGIFEIRRKDRASLLLLNLESAAAQLAEIALDLATKAPALVYRNPERLKQGSERMRADRAWFMEFFGSDVQRVRSAA